MADGVTQINVPYKALINYSLEEHNATTSMFAKLHWPEERVKDANETRTITMTLTRPGTDNNEASQRKK